MYDAGTGVTDREVDLFNTFFSYTFILYTLVYTPSFMNIFNPLDGHCNNAYTCPTCFLECRSSRGLTQHQNSAHRQFTPESNGDENQPISTNEYHPHLTAKPCNEAGEYLLPYTRPPDLPNPLNGDAPDSWDPFNSRIEFDFALYHFVEAQSSAGLIDKALDLWAATVGDSAPWKNSKELYATIDAIKLSESPWKTYTVRYQGPRPLGTAPKWMMQTYVLCARDSHQVLLHQLETAQYKDKINLSPYRQFDSNHQRTWSNLMSADWAWTQADEIAKDEATHGAMFVPVVAGSDKTTVSVATGHQEYHPVYMSPGNLSNIARRAHGNALLPVAFLPIPKTTKKHRKSAKYQVFCRQMYHACLARVFQPLKVGMTTPEVVRCPDGHFRRAIYGLGPYIADYPEQVWLAAIVQGWCPKCDAKPDNLDAGGARLRSQIKTELLINSWDPGILWTDFGVRADIIPFTSSFPRADIYQLLSADLLHQIIKGTFKDHIVMWVNEYLLELHGEARGQEIVADIDHRISAVPAFPKLRRFPDGRDFSQWTGDDSKALMKVYLGAIAGHVPAAVVKCLSAFLDFCYIVRRNAITPTDLDKLKDSLARFHHYRTFFVGTAGVKGEFISLPRQHSLLHYIRSIRLFGSPNGLCSSITESKHIKAVKEPWRRSSRYKALIQMLKTISRLEKLAAARRAFTQLGMMDGTTASYTAMVQEGGQPQPRPALEADDGDDGDDGGPVSGPKALSSVELACLPARGYPTSAEAISADDVPLEHCPVFVGRVHVFHSAVARFFAPSDLCGAGGMYQERIRCNPSWRDEYARYDTVFVQTGPDVGGMKGMVIGRVRLFFSFTSGGSRYPCALVEWLTPKDNVDEDTRMWVVTPEFERGIRGRRTLAIIHLDCIARAAHLIPVFGSSFIPEELHFSNSLDVYRSYFVNNNVDHHCQEFLS
ncbi:hypothetical protein F5888DRAFT_1807962 [Russula emetica]|nr:hypothetical protein F5888DRAFT_1807962 [Russula emetica]